MLLRLSSTTSSWAGDRGVTVMQYETPVLRVLGTFGGLTMGNNGSCPDGNGDNDQLGGGDINQPGSGPGGPVECGPGTAETGSG